MLLAAGLLLVSLAGCATPSAPSEAPASSARPSVSPTPAPEVRPALSDLVVSPAGLGPLRVGTPVPDAEADVALVTWDALGCGDSAGPRVEGEPFAGFWRSVYPDDVSAETGTFDVVTVGGVQGGPIANIIVKSAEPATAEGIHVGSTLDDVLAAYPGATLAEETSVSTVYLLEGETGSLTIEIARESEGTEGYWKPSVLGTVVWMVAWEPSQAIGAIAASDGAGPCPV
jgi:hypothetical protein